MFDMLKKYRKLLCCLFVMFFLIGFGGEVVKAEIFVNGGPNGGELLKYREYKPGKYTQFYHIKSEHGDEVYCLNSSKDFPRNVNLIPMGEDLVPENKRQGVINIINAGTPSNLGLDSHKTYYITQAAVWYYLDGIKPESDNANGITQGFYNWIQRNYKTQWDKLMNSVENNINDFKLNLKGNNKLTDSGDVLISEDFVIDSSVEGTITVSINQGSTDDSCILYNNECKASFDNIPVGTNMDTKFKIRIPKPNGATGEVNADFTIKVNKQVNEYTLETYGTATISTFQNVALVKTNPKTLSITGSVSGEYDNDLDVAIKKIDYETGKKVSGAELTVFKDNGSDSGIWVGTVISTGEGEPNPILALEPGDYYIKETLIPTGYGYSFRKVNFSVKEINNDLKVIQDEKELDDATVIAKNKLRRIVFKKVDEKGNPIEGVIIKVTDYADKATGVKNHTLCAKTDKDGLLTKDCDGSGNSIVTSTGTQGVYILGEDFGSQTGPYIITEECVDESCKMYDMTKFADDTKFAFGAYDNGLIVSLRDDVIVDYSDEEVPTVTVSIVNSNYFYISKVDAVGGHEIAGATLRVFDPSISEGDNVIDEWESSEDGPHMVSGIEFGKRYGITEVVTPEGYFTLETTVHFELNEDGTVKVFDPETGDEIKDLAGSNYSLLIKNDYTKIEISKVDMVSGEEIEGAKLKICTASEYESKGLECEPSKKEWTWTSGKDAHYIDKMGAGKYYLIETIAPTGYYKKTSALEFTVKNDGGIQSYDMENKLTEMKVYKIDQATKKRVGGAHFEILNASDRSIAKDYLGNELKWVSTTDSDWEIKGIPVGEYILVETQAPENFQEGMIIDGELTNEYKFTINESEDVEFVLEIEVMNAPNTAVSTINVIAIGGLVMFIGYQVIKRRKLYN